MSNQKCKKCSHVSDSLLIQNFCHNCGVSFSEYSNYGQNNSSIQNSKIQDKASLEKVNLGFGIRVSKKTRLSLLIIYMICLVLILGLKPKSEDISISVENAKSEADRKAAVSKQIQDIINDPTVVSRNIYPNNFYVPSYTRPDTLEIPSYRDTVNIPTYTYTSPVKCVSTFTKKPFTNEINGWETKC